MKWNALSVFSLILGLSVSMVVKAADPIPPASSVTGSGTATGSGTVTGDGTVKDNGDGTETITGTVTIIGTVTVKISDLNGPDKEGPVALDTEEQTFLTLINALRAQHGLAALKVSDKLDQSSKWMSTDMATKNYFPPNHVDSSGKSPFDRMSNVSYHSESEGENIAAGNADAQATYLQWFNSPDHLQNMLNPAYTEIGIGRAYDANSTYKWYWTTDFGSN